MNPVARVSTNIYRILRTQQMSVLVLLCTIYTTFSAPIGGHLQVVCGGHLQVVCNTKITIVVAIFRRFVIQKLQLWWPSSSGLKYKNYNCGGHLQAV
jgi:hypothetical protein